MSEHERTMRVDSHVIRSRNGAATCVYIDDICNYIIDNIDALLLRDLSSIVRAPYIRLDKKLFGAQTM